jgi:hypothetical protein
LPGATPVNVAEAWNAPPSKLYSNPAPVGAVTSIVPVGTAQVGCTVTVAVGAAGGVGTALTVTVAGADIQVGSAVLITVMLCAPGATPVNVAEAWKTPPSKLYWKFGPVGALTTMVPVGTAHVGCTVTDAVGAAGAPGTAFTVTVVGADSQVGSAVLITVITWSPGVTPVNVAEAWKAPPSKLYWKFAPDGALTTMVPVGTAHVGCTVTLAVGAAGGVGIAFTVTVVGADIQVGDTVLRTVIS